MNGVRNLNHNEGTPAIIFKNGIIFFTSIFFVKTIQYRAQ